MKNCWHGLSIKYKIWIFIFTMIFFVSILNLYLHNNNHKILNGFNRHLNNYYAINELFETIKTNKNCVEGYIEELDEEYKDSYYENKDKIIHIIDDLKKRFKSRDAYFELNAITNSINTTYKYWDNAIELRADGNKEYYISLYKGIGIYDYTKSYIQKLLNIGLADGTIVYNQLVMESNAKNKLSLLIILLWLAFSIFVGMIFSNYIINPIKKLANASIEISKGNLDIEKVRIQSKDEVGILTDSFNTMSTSIKCLVENLQEKVIVEKKLHEEEIELLRMEQLLKEARFLALQSQINPHFLFNTLNTISRVAMFEEADDTMQLIQSLANIFRYRLRHCENSISLEEELQIIEEYVHLQKYRFNERLSFELQCQIQTNDIFIPIFLLQPIIENAIIHGIEPKVEGGKLRIKIFERNEKIYINIFDTGKGMPKDVVVKLLDSENEKEVNSIGLKNVYNRMKLFFQNECEFIIRSKEDVGTSILLIIPRI